MILHSDRHSLSTFASTESLLFEDVDVGNKPGSKIIDLDEVSPEKRGLDQHNFEQRKLDENNTMKREGQSYRKLWSYAKKIELVKNESLSVSFPQH